MKAALPLSHLKVVELAAQGPGPFSAALLADFGADVVMIDRPSSDNPGGAERRFDTYNRNKRSIALDLKSDVGRKTALSMIEKADVFIEGYRPGVTERLGLGPDICLQINPKLIYGRMTGWGQDGPWAQEAGHDINYLALTGALAAMGTPGTPPPPPLNLVADLGGGGMYLAFGILAAVMEAQRSQKGQIIDCAMVDGVSHLMSMFQSFRQQGSWTLDRQSNLVDGGAPFYGTYKTRDDKYVAVGAIEPQFWRALLQLLDIPPEAMPDQMDKAQWPSMRERIGEAFLELSRDQWINKARGVDACISPVLTIDEAWEHPQLQSRETFKKLDGVIQPSPAPRLSRTPGQLRKAAPEPNADAETILRDWGL